jgi:hypothetical protein
VSVPSNVDSVRLGLRHESPLFPVALDPLPALDVLAQQVDMTSTITTGAASTKGAEW